MPITKICVWCREKYQIKPYMKDFSKFCSKKCKWAHQQRDFKNVPCSYCGKPIVVNWYRKNRKKVYCDLSCYHKAIAAKSEVTCAGCGTPFIAYKSRQNYYSKLYCSQECYLEFGDMPSTHGYVVNKKYEKIRQRLCCHAQYLKWKSQVLIRDGYKCIRCGNILNLRVHHKMELYRIVYKYNPKLSINELGCVLTSTEFNDLSNGITLCNSCHIKEHRK